jgi:hypothetical protein
MFDLEFEIFGIWNLEFKKRKIWQPIAEQIFAGQFTNGYARR